MINSLIQPYNPLKLAHFVATLFYVSGRIDRDFFGIVFADKAEDTKDAKKGTDTAEEATESPVETASAEDTDSAEGSKDESADGFAVNKKGFIEADGEIEELLPGLKFKVRLDNGHEIMATLAGKMRIHKIMLVLGDRVKVEMSPYDLTKGRIRYRY